jgi:gamma-glutamyltranspeptidase/glutathione hydrolase
MTDADSIKTFYVNGKAPVAGTIFRNPDLAKAFRLIQQQGRDRILSRRYRSRHRREVEGPRWADGRSTILRTTKASGSRPRQRPTVLNSRLRARGAIAGMGIVEALNVLEACVPTWYPGKTLASLGPANRCMWHALVETKKAV